MSKRDCAPDFTVRNGQLIITIGVDALANFIESANTEPTMKIINPVKLAHSVGLQLVSENETGETAIDRMIDSVMDNILDYSDGISYDT